MWCRGPCCLVPSAPAAAARAHACPCPRRTRLALPCPTPLPPGLPPGRRPQVKGSPYPRSYYKCSQAGCPAKKIIERDPKSGRISQAELKVGAGWRVEGGASSWPAGAGLPGGRAGAAGEVPALHAWRCLCTPQAAKSAKAARPCPPGAAPPQSEHNHPKPGQVRGHPPRAGYAGALHRQGSGARQAQRQRRVEEEEDAEEEGEEEAAADAEGSEEGSEGAQGAAGEGEELQQEDAVAALATMKYSPVVPGMLGAAPHDTPASLLPIPASLRASAEPEDPAANGWAVQPGAAPAPHRLHRSSGPAVAAAAGGGGGDDSELSGWRFCRVCGMRLDASWPLAAWHMQQHMQAQQAAHSLAAHAHRAPHLGRTPAAGSRLGRPHALRRRSPGLCVRAPSPSRGIPPKLPARGTAGGANPPPRPPPLC